MCVVNYLGSSTPLPEIGENGLKLHGSMLPGDDCLPHPNYPGLDVTRVWDGSDPDGELAILLDSPAYHFYGENAAAVLRAEAQQFYEMLRQLLPDTPYIYTVNPSGYCGCFLGYTSDPEKELRLTQSPELAAVPLNPGAYDTPEYAMREWLLTRSAFHSLVRYLDDHLAHAELTLYSCWERDEDIPAFSEHLLTPQAILRSGQAGHGTQIRYRLVTGLSTPPPEEFWREDATLEEWFASASHPHPDIRSHAEGYNRWPMDFDTIPQGVALYAAARTPEAREALFAMIARYLCNVTPEFPAYSAMDEMVTQGLQDPSLQIRQQAITSLSRVDMAAAAPLLREQFDREPVGNWLRYHIASRLSAGSDGQQADLLLLCMSGGGNEMRKRAINDARNLVAAVPTLIAILKSPADDMELRAEVLRTLAYLDGKAAADTFAGIVGDLNARDCAGLLSYLNDFTIPEFIPIFLNALQDSHGDVRHEALARLSKYNDQSLRPHFVAMLDDVEEYVREVAQDAIDRLDRA